MMGSGKKATRSIPGSPLSGRALTALMQHQRRLDKLLRELQTSDRMLAGALAGCDAPSQTEMLANYLENVQEVRVAVQRLEAFLLSRLSSA
jgi:hypothetical protein